MLAPFKYASTYDCWYGGILNVHEKPPPLPPQGVGAVGAVANTLS